MRCTLWFSADETNSYVGFISLILFIEIWNRVKIRKPVSYRETWHVLQTLLTVESTRLPDVIDELMKFENKCARTRQRSTLRFNSVVGKTRESVHGLTFAVRSAVGTTNIRDELLISFRSRRFPRAPTA